MGEYKKPEIMETTGLFEGVYMASGDEGTNNGQPVCQSKYMLGKWKKPGRGIEQGKVIDKFGCEGCSADDGDGCKIKKGKISDLNKNGDFRPTWERQGKNPDDISW